MNRQRTGFAVLDGKPKTAEQRRHAIEAELRALPELEAPGPAWSAIEERLEAGKHPPRRVGAGRGGYLDHRKFEKQRFLRPALAAGIAVASLIGAALLVDEDAAPLPQQVAGVASPEGEMVALMERSRLAETRRRTLPVLEGARLAAAGGVEVSRMEARRLLAARIASVDASLNRLATVETADPAARERLWRERAELMDTLMRAEQVQREAFIRRAVY